MTEELKKYLNRILNETEGLHSIIISDKDGVAIVKATDDKLPELAAKPPFLSAFSVISQLAIKLGIGKSKRFCCVYSNYQVVQINNSPLVVTFIADTNSNTGYLSNLYEDLNPLVEDLKCMAYENCQLEHKIVLNMDKWIKMTMRKYETLKVAYPYLPIVLSVVGFGLFYSLRRLGSPQLNYDEVVVYHKRQN